MKKIICLFVSVAVLAMLALSVGTTGCNTLGGSSTNVTSEVTTIQDIQIGGDAAAATAILYAGFVGNQTLAAQIVADQQNFDALCAAGITTVQSGTNVSFAVIEANLAALAKSIEQSFASSASASASATATVTAPAPAPALAIKSAKASLASAQSKVASAKPK